MARGRTLRTWLVAGAVLALATSAMAKVETPAQVRFHTRNGRSQYVKVTVTFAMGAELNSIAETSRYDARAPYALIFLPSNKVVVIKGAGFSQCRDEITASCLPHYGVFEGVDQAGLKWEVCAVPACP